MIIRLLQSALVLIFLAGVAAAMAQT